MTQSDSLGHKLHDTSPLTPKWHTRKVTLTINSRSRSVTLECPTARFSPGSGRCFMQVPERIFEKRREKKREERKEGEKGREKGREKRKRGKIKSTRKLKHNEN